MPAIKKVCVLLICAICHLLCAFCDAAFEDVAAAARVAGMGNAFVGMADDVSALFYNPAGISRIRLANWVPAMSSSTPAFLMTVRFPTA